MPEKEQKPPLIIRVKDLETEVLKIHLQENTEQAAEEALRKDLGYDILMKNLVEKGWFQDGKFLIDVDICVYSLTSRYKNCIVWEAYPAFI